LAAELMTTGMIGLDAVDAISAQRANRLRFSSSLISPAKCKPGSG
jgi:hypothetical protein